MARYESQTPETRAEQARPEAGPGPFGIDYADFNNHLLATGVDIDYLIFAWIVRQQGKLGGSSKSSGPDAGAI